MRYDQMCKHQDQRTMTSDHGRLLQDSGFLKLDSPRSSSSSSARTTMQEVTGLYCPFMGDPVDMAAMTHFHPLSSGRRATATTQWTGGPSTSASHRTAAGYIASIRSNIKPELTRAVILHQLRQAIDKLRELSSPKTFYLPSRSGHQELRQATLSWAPSSGITRRTGYSDGELWLRRGSIQTPQAMMLGDMFDPDYGTLVSSASISKLLKTRSTTASGKYGST